MKTIRIIGDTTLHQPGLIFPQNPTFEQLRELAKQIDLAKSILINSGGAGIAANQCSAIEWPYCFTIVGVFYDNPEHTNRVQDRYPNIKFPEAKILVNPEIESISHETQVFNHACLSVPGGNRCAIISPSEINIIYQDPTKDMQTVNAKFSEIDAVVLWHELKHIIEGKTYIDIMLESLSLADLTLFREMLFTELKKRDSEHYSVNPEKAASTFHYSVKMNDKSELILDPNELTAILSKMTNETLAGILRQTISFSSGKKPFQEKFGKNN